MSRAPIVLLCVIVTLLSCILLVYHGVYSVGQFTPCESDRRLVPWDVWIRLKEYFPDAPEFPALHPVCKECMVRLSL